MTAISEEQVRRRAFEIWEAEGRPHGCDLEHWLRAEHELNAGAVEAPAKAPKKTAAKAVAKAAKPAKPDEAPAAKSAAKAPAKPRKSAAKV